MNRTPEQLAQFYKDACLAELQALKPGNVHLFADGHGMTVQDFIASANASAAVIALPDLNVGERILASVKATRQAVNLNTNLGVILLSAPIIQAAMYGKAQTFAESLSLTLRKLTVEDAILSAEAIMLASPAGLGEAAEHDVRQSPKVTLLEMMRVAEHQDRIASQYLNGFYDILQGGLTRYRDALTKWENAAYATTALYLGFMANFPDTHIVRKYGKTFALQIQKEAQEIAQQYWLADNPKLMQKSLLAWDASLKSRGINPGTSADLTVACLLVNFLV